VLSQRMVTQCLRQRPVHLNLGEFSNGLPPPSSLPSSTMAMKPFLTLVVILLIMMSGGVASLTGAPECPCAKGDEPFIQQAKEQLAALGVPDKYGMGECKAHDKGLALRDCDNLDENLEEKCKKNFANHGTFSDVEFPDQEDKCFCFQKWCFVDSEKCPINKEKCEADGEEVGNGDSPYCRDREMVAWNATVTAHMSYATCGGPGPRGIVEGRELRVKIKESIYWTMRGNADEMDAEWKGWTGVLTKALDFSFRNQFEPNVKVTVDEGWVSNTSKEQFPNNYWTACVFDVAVGNADMCIGDFWVTPKRMNLANFLTPFDNDNFFLVAPRDSQEPIEAVLKKPFLPFHGSLWLVIVCFLVFSAFAMAVTDSHNTKDYNNQGKLPVTIKALYFAFLGYVKGGAANNPLSVPGRLANLGFGFFVLITLASYTANLTTVLVSRGSVSGITGVQNAIDKGLKICVASEVLEPLEQYFSGARKSEHFVQVNETAGIPRSLYLGRCDCAIMPEWAIYAMHAGNYSRKDCEGADSLVSASAAGDKMSFADADAKCGCVRNAPGGQGRADRDCYLARVGGLIMSVPLSMPVRADLAQTLSWALRKTVQKGILDEEKNTYKKKWLLQAPPVCGVDGSLLDAANGDPIEQLRLGPDAMVGTTLISIGIMVIALLLALVEMRTGRNMQQLMGFENPSDPDILRDDMGMEKEPLKWRRTSLGRKRILPYDFTRLASAAPELQNHKLNEIHRMLAKLSGEDTAVDWRPDDVQTSNQIMPFAPPTSSFKGLRPLPHTSSNRSAKSGCSGVSYGLPQSHSGSSSRTLRTVSAASTSIGISNAPEECVLERGKVSGQEDANEWRRPGILRGGSSS